MPRNTRIDPLGAVHHIIVRGLERRKIFNDDVDRINFLDLLGKVLSETEAEYLTAGGQYECSAWRTNSIRKLIFTNG